MSLATMGLIGRIEAIAGALVVVMAFIAAGSVNWPVMAVGVTLLVTGHLMMAGAAIAASRTDRPRGAESERAGI